MNCCMHWPPVVGNCLHLPETTRWPKVFSDSIQKLQAVSSPTEWIQPFPISFVLSVIRGIARVMRNIKNHFRRKRTIRLISHRVNKLRGANPKVCDSSLTKRILKKEIPLLNPDNANRVSLPWFILFSHQVKIVHFLLVYYLTAAIHHQILLLGESESLSFTVLDLIYHSVSRHIFYAFWMMDARNFFQKYSVWWLSCCQFELLMPEWMTGTLFSGWYTQHYKCHT